MKSQTVALVLSTLSLAGVGLLHFRLDRLEEQGSLRRSAATRTPVVEERVEVGLEAAPRPDSVARGGSDGAPDVRRERPEGSAGAPGDDALEAIVERVVREKLEHRDRQAAFPVHDTRMRVFDSADQMARELELSAAQQDRVRAALDRSRQRMDDVLRIPDETGRSPFERKREREEKLRESLKNRDAGEAVAFVGGMSGDLRKKIPGRGTTYGDELARIRKEGKEEIASVLDPKQRETFESAHTDPLFGSDGAVSISMIAFGEGPDVPGGILEMVEEETPAPPSSK